LGFDLDVPADGDRAGTFLQRSLRLERNHAACTPSGAPEPVTSGAPWAMWRWKLHCARSGPGRLSAEFVGLLRGGHRHMARLEEGHARAVEQVLDLSKTDWDLGDGAAASSAGSSLTDYVVMGVEHLLTGWDHMAFLLALLLLAKGLREVVGLVTSFTVAHTITLALSVLRVVQPETTPVEALIGFSIALVGAENCWLLSGRGAAIPTFVAAGLGAMALSGGAAVGRAALIGLMIFCVCHFALLRRYEDPAVLRVLVAFAFGLIHGFGFAGVMRAVELPPGRLVPALFGFNAGVEIGQLAIVAMLWPLLRALDRVRDGRWSRLFTEAASAAICGLGIFWFVARSR
jgi:hypothetical protein